MNIKDQERNFRTHYYDKVGFRAVEEKKSVETLLKEQPIKKEKLSSFCLRFGIPAVYRMYVWKILLDILPLNQSNQEFVWHHRLQQIDELKRAILLIRPQCLHMKIEQVVLRMRFIEEGALPFQNESLTDCPSDKNFLSIVEAVNRMMTCEDNEVYWISTRFYRHICKNVYPALLQFSELTLQCLQKEDADNRLHKHLNDLNLKDTSLLDSWFYSCYAGVLPESALERIWDRVIAGSSHILIYTAVTILLTLRRPLLALTTTNAMLTYLKQVPEDCSDRIVNDATDLLYKNLCPKSNKPDSPFGIDNIRNSSGKSGPSKSRQGSLDTASPVEKVMRSLGDSKSVTIEIGRKSPGTVDK